MNEEEAAEKIQALEAELERTQRQLKRLQSVLIWSGSIAILALLGFFLARTLLSRPAEPLPPAPPPPVEKPQASPESEPEPVYNPPPSVSPPPEMPDFQK